MRNFGFPTNLLLVVAFAVIGNVLDGIFVTGGLYLTIVLSSIGFFIIPIFLKLVSCDVEKIRETVQ